MARIPQWKLLIVIKWSAYSVHFVSFHTWQTATFKSTGEQIYSSLDAKHSLLKVNYNLPEASRRDAIAGWFPILIQYNGATQQDSRPESMWRRWGCWNHTALEVPFTVSPDPVPYGRVHSEALFTITPSLSSAFFFIIDQAMPSFSGFLRNEANVFKKEVCCTNSWTFLWF